MLELHKGTYFFGSEDLGAKLFIRDFWYDAVENRLKEHFSSGGKAMAIIGNPGDVRQHYLLHFSSSGCIRSSYFPSLLLICAGIGKSMLGYLLLWKWACEGKRVVVAKAGQLHNRPVLFCTEGAFILTEKELRMELDNANVM